MTLQFTLNGREVRVETEPGRRLLDLLREDLGLSGTKEGCGEGECGACTVVVDGVPRLACLTVALQVEGRDVLTIEGLAAAGKLHPLQEAFIATAGVQCGFCTPGLIMAAYALLQENPRPTRDEIRDYLGGNLCRCTGYAQVVEAVERAAGEIAPR